MKVKLVFLLFTILGLSSCSPDELTLIKDDPFMVKNMDPLDVPVVQVNKVTGASKVFSIYASNLADSIVSFTATGATKDFAVDPLVFKMLDPTKPVTSDANGKLSRKLAAVVFEYTVRVPNTFVEGEYSVTFNITSGKGETKSIVAKFEASSFMASGVGTYFNGRVISSNRNYVSTASAFFGFTITLTNVTDNSVTPPIVNRVATGVTLLVNNASTATTTTNRANIYGHIYTDLSNYDKRLMYLVSPRTNWIADSLRILNKFTGTYPTTQMNDIKYLDLGQVDFGKLRVSDLTNKQIGTAGASKVVLIKGNGYGFLTNEGKIAVVYVKNILYYTPSFTSASPNVYLLLKVQD